MRARVGPVEQEPRQHEEDPNADSELPADVERSDGTRREDRDGLEEVITRHGQHCDRPETVAWLLDHGANIAQKATFGGPSHGQGITALHLAAQYGHLRAVKLLVDRGADRSTKDDLYQATAEGSANYFGQNEVRDYLQALGA